MCRCLTTGSARLGGVVLQSTIVVISSGGSSDFSFGQLDVINEQVFDPSALAGGTRDGYELGIRKVIRNKFAFSMSDRSGGEAA